MQMQMHLPVRQSDGPCCLQGGEGASRDRRGRDDQDHAGNSGAE